MANGIAQRTLKYALSLPVALPAGPEAGRPDQGQQCYRGRWTPVPDRRQRLYHRCCIVAAGVATTWRLPQTAGPWRTAGAVLEGLLDHANRRRPADLPFHHGDIFGIPLLDSPLTIA